MFGDSLGLGFGALGEALRFRVWGRVRGDSHEEIVPLRQDTQTLGNTRKVPTVLTGT